MGELGKLIEKRRVCRQRYSKSEKLVIEDQGAADFLIREGAEDDEVHLKIREAAIGFAKLEKIYNELSEVQDLVDYHPDNENRLKTVVDDGEEKYIRSYNKTNAKMQHLEACLSKPVVEEDDKSESKASFTPEDFKNCFTEALQAVNTGIKADQLTQILTTLTQKKVDIQIPKFKGEAELFDQWQSLVEAEVRKPGYTEVEKAHIVISLVEGEVSKLLASLKDPTYEELMTFLENRYGDVLARIESSINEMANIPAVTNPTVKELDPLYNKLVANWNYITKKTKDDPGVLETSWILTAIVRPKLPKSMIKRWDAERIREEKRGSPSILPMTFDSLLEKIQDAVKVARRSIPVVSVPKKESHKDSPKDKSKPSSYALSVTKGETKQHEKKRCVFCSDNHLSYTCTKVSKMPVDERCERVKSSGACFNCLGSHMVKYCKQRGCKVCHKNHHTLLHYENKKENGGKDASRQSENSSFERNGRFSDSSVSKVYSSVGLVKSLSSTMGVLMQTGVVKLESKYAVTQGRVLFDSGSGVTFISKKMANQLNLKGPKVEGEFLLAGGGKMTLRTERVKFQLSSAIPGWKGETFEIEAYVIERPSADLNPVEIDISKSPHLKGLQLADTYPREKREIDVMLGIEDTTNILMDKRIKGPRGWPVAQRSHIGWILSGTCPDSMVEEKQVVNRVSFEIADETELATRHWETEHIGILPDEDNLKLTNLEESALQQHTEKTHQVGDRYETGLIRHPQYLDQHLISNKSLAVKRLISLERKLSRDSALAAQYKAQINDLLANGRAEKVDENQEPRDRQVWYLPHHPVIKMDRSTTKVRVVFDGSMVGYEGVSLNDTLLPGPALQPDLPGVLMRFRRHKIAIVADIEKMFLQIKMRAVDQDMQRFLWRDLDSSKEPEVYRLTTVTFGLTPSPFSSIQTLLDHARKYREDYPKAVAEIEGSVFVDDVLTGEDTVEDAATLAIDLKTVLGEGGWPLRKFLSNRPESLSLLDEKDLAPQHTEMVIGNETATKTLGVKYDPTGDILMFSFCDKMEDVGGETKRTILRQLHRVYDPLGMVSPFTVLAKQIFQLTWMAGKGWDERVPEDLEQKWLKWKNEVPILDEIKVDRCLIPEDFVTPAFTLHGFGDASEAAYGGVVYLRLEDSRSSKVHTALLCSKTRVAPVGKKRTIPELELMAALVTARLIKYVEKELKLPIENKPCWTDSQVALQWIRKPAYTWQTFVANRVSEIQGLVPPNNWKHIPGKYNPADLCSRGMSASALVEANLWWDGPTFLRCAENEWPKQPNIESEKSEEAKRKEKHRTINVFSVTPKQDKPDPLEEYVKKFSSFTKFIRVMALVRSLVKKIREKESTVLDEGSPLTSLADRRSEEIWWIRWAQQKAFGEEIELLKLGNKFPEKSKLSHLNPYWDNDQKVIRVGGRLNYSTLPEETKHPIILPKHNPLVEKLVMDYHVRNLHTGGAQTLASLRSRYWLVHGRLEVRRILHNCRTCREPVKLAQKMAPLPKERICIMPAFTNVGIDFAGPLYVKVTDRSQKVYICLFSCMVTRAIHLELVHDMSTEHFILALKRMMSRRGRIRLIISDNAKTLLSNKDIQWHFITERAPWHGGFYERMVQNVKKTLKRVLGNSRLSMVELETVLIEVEAQVNSRPLTLISSSSEDLAPLTPGHLAIGRNLQALPNVDQETCNTALGKRWRYQQRLLKEIWTRWTNEYLLELNVMKKWVDIQKNVQVGDVVLIAEDNQPRREWLLGRVMDVHPGRDGLVRSVTLKTPKGMRRRPIQRLRMLEAADEDQH
jgi:hypothetical protein